MQVISAESTELFAGPPDAPLQLVRVRFRGRSEAIRVEGDGLRSDGQPRFPEPEVAEVPVEVDDPVPGQQRDARVVVDDDSTAFCFVVAEPGWTMYMISHFHYDPVWWNTQGAYTSEWNEDPPGRQMNGFALVHAHLEMARREQEYKFVLAEVDYLKPYWDACPEDRDDLRRLIADGRLEIMGGAYNEPNTNLTSPETTIRNFVHGMGFQRDIMGAEPATAWQLDVFGHDPQFPGMAADAGLTSSSWARGPHHQWGPMAGDRDPCRMQFSSEFEWIAPSGRGLLTHYMPAHYGAGWGMDSSPTLQKAEEATYKLFESLKKVALTRNVLLPVGTDYTPPNKWVTEIHRDWNARYTWPRFISALPREFFAAVRKELDEKGIAASPQTRDMNPIYTGKDVSYIDTKQANRATETAVLDAERLAVFACLLGGATYPQAALEKAWVQLAYGAHHDAITGSESDQVYLDLLTGWRDAWELGRTVRDNSLALLSSAVDGSVAVWNTLAHNRTDIITARLDERLGNGVGVLDADGEEVPSLVQHGGRSVSWLARDVPSMGWRAYRLAQRGLPERPLVAAAAAAAAAGAQRGWEPLDGNEIANEHYRLTVDPGRGGAVSSLVDLGSEHELIAKGGAGNEVAVYDEYSTHPHSGEGPWHLIPKGPVTGSATFPAESVQALRCPLGQRIIVRGRIGKLLSYNQILTLWDGVARVDCQTTIDGFTDADRLIRLRWPCPVPGALPVSEVGDAVIGRGFGLLHEGGAPDAVDTKDHPWTLDNPAYGWFGLSSTARVRAGDSVRAMSVAEVVTPSEATSAALARDLMVALVRAGVTATCSSGDRSRYGALDVDSNLPDTRIAIGGPDENAFTAEVLAAADPVYADEVKRQLYANSVARVWVPAAAPLRSEWVPDADLRGVRRLPVLVIAANDLATAVAAVVDDLADAEIVVAQDAPTGAEPFEQRTVALLNRGVPGFAVEPDGTLHASLMRSCSGWPSGTWIDEPRRTAPDGSNFQLQHWTHTFDYAVVSGDGDWRAARLPTRSAEYSHSLLVAPAGRENGGGLPSFGSLLEVEPADSVMLGAVKPAGNPLAAGRSAPVDPAKAVVVRLVECCGSATEVGIRSGLRKVALSSRVDLLEEPLARQTVSNALTLQGFEIATVLARLNLPKVLDADHHPLAPDTEAAQPLYARYWLHNRGPAPMGGLPAVTYLHPARVTAEPDASAVVRLTAASDCTDAALHGKVRVVCPDGWTASPAELPFVLPPGEHLEADVEIAMPSDAPSGVYPVRAELSVTGSDLTSIPPAWRQTVEDVCLVIVEPPAAHHWNLTAFRRRGRVPTPELLKLISEPEAVEVAAGCSARLAITMGTDACADLAAEAHLISPWGTWEWMGPPAIGATLPAQGQVDMEFDVAPPEWVEPGEWWALIRVGCAGRLLYTPAVKVTVR